MTTPRSVIFFGSGPLGERLLQHALTQPEITLVGVVTAPTSRRDQKAISPIVALAESNQIPVFQPDKPSDITSELQALKAEAGLLLAYGKMIPDEIIESFPLGIVNIHPSLLPHHRGPSPIEAAILNGDTKAGVTLMIISSAMDAGPILAQQSFLIQPNITKAELTSQLLDTAESLVSQHFSNYLAGKLEPTPQHAWRGASYCSLIKKTNGDVSLADETAISLDRKVRAYAGWPGVRIAIHYNGQPLNLALHEVGLTDLSPTRPIELIDSEVIAQTGLGAVVLKTVQLPGKNRISGRDLLNGGEVLIKD